MGIYSKYLLPKIVHRACSDEASAQQRTKVVPHAEGVVLEIGIGSGLNLSFYEPTRVSRVIGVDPSPEMTRMAMPKARLMPFDVEFINLPAEALPLDSNSIDTVLITYTLCTILDTERALDQMRRVLKPGGKLLFCEHGAAPEADVRRWQDLMTPLWRWFGGGCHLNRDIPTLIEAGGFRIADVSNTYLPGWRPASFNYWGSARSA